MVVFGNCEIANRLIALSGSSTVFAISTVKVDCHTLVMAPFTSLMTRCVSGVVWDMLKAQVLTALITVGAVLLVNPSQFLRTSPYMAMLWIISSQARRAALARSVVRLRPGIIIAWPSSSMLYR